jgi:hypothetical protein
MVAIAISFIWLPAVVVIAILMIQARKRMVRVNHLKEAMHQKEKETNTTPVRFLIMCYGFKDSDIIRMHQLLDHNLPDEEMLKRLEEIYLV